MVYRWGFNSNHLHAQEHSLQTPYPVSGIICKGHYTSIPRVKPEDSPTHKASFEQMRCCNLENPAQSELFYSRKKTVKKAVTSIAGETCELF